MDIQNIVPDQSIALFVKNILVFENSESSETILPFFADGYPGLLFHQTENGITIQPHGKKMPTFFLYGQTIKPINIHVNGHFQIIIFQLYPFVLRAFWGINPREINDGCHYLTTGPENDINKIISNILFASTIEEKIRIIANLLLDYFKHKSNKLDFLVREAIQYIIDSRGIIAIKEIAKKEKLNIRTLERRFLRETGISAKQFAKIVQFQSSLNQLETKDFSKINDIVYANGYADQSHFIRVFKAFTGVTPNTFGKI